MYDVVLEISARANVLFALMKSNEEVYRLL